MILVSSWGGGDGGWFVLFPMKFLYNNEEYDVIVVKKKTTKHTYIRVKDDLKIYITTNTRTSQKYLENLVTENYSSVVRMIEHVKKKRKNNQNFHYLGKEYEIVYVQYTDISIGDYKVFLKKDFDVDKWYKKQAKKIYQEHLDRIYQEFSRRIPYPSLRIRKMKTRWGVCNIKSKTVTLNLELIKRDLKYLDYVIVHELSHLIHANHSKAFWSLVEENCPNYKMLRSDMKEF